MVHLLEALQATPRRAGQQATWTEAAARHRQLNDRAWVAAQ